MNEKILVLDFGGQYDQLIARRVRELHVFAEIEQYDSITVDEIKSRGYKGIIFTGGPNSVYDPASPHFDAAVLGIGVPILGICYGAQLIAFMSNGEVKSAESSSEYGFVELIAEGGAIFKDVPERSQCWMSHTDFIAAPPAGFVATAHTSKCPVAAMEDVQRKIYAVQFHPEVTHTEYGKTMLRNFVFDVCGCTGDWQIEDFVANSIEKYRVELDGQRALCALSGGVDSSVAAVLLSRAMGDRLTCVFVDHGLLRKGDAEFVEQVLRGHFGLNIIHVDARERFLSKLAGVTEPERKRKIIGEEFIRVFEAEAAKLGDIPLLVQGTIYPDVVESGKGGADTIKSHHNVGGLPEHMSFTKIVEPLRELFKDEVREAGEKLGIPHNLVWRQPFPGPGLAIRIIGEVTQEKLDTLREADAIFREEVDRGCGQGNDQYFAVLTDTRSVGVMGDARTYGHTVALRCVTTDDFMTADWTRLPYDLLARASGRITNEVKGINRIVYDITSKPPATVEWE